VYVTGPLTWLQPQVWGLVLVSTEQKVEGGMSYRELARSQSGRNGWKAGGNARMAGVVPGHGG